MRLALPDRLIRIVLVSAIIWAFVGALDRQPTTAVAARRPKRARRERAGVNNFFPEARLPWSARGRLAITSRRAAVPARSGPPISNQFTLLGSTVQIFSRFMLKQDASGTVAAVNLIDAGEIPARGAAGEALPLADPSLIAAAAVIARLAKLRDSGSGLREGECPGPVGGAAGRLLQGVPGHGSLRGGVPGWQRRSWPVAGDGP